MKFFIPVAPRTKKNSQRIAKRRTSNGYDRLFILPSEAYKNFEKDCEPYIPKLGISSPVNIKATYRMPTRHKTDLCNLHEALCDVLVKYGCVEDDNYTIIAAMDGSRVVYDKDGFGIDVEITNIEEVADE